MVYHRYKRLILMIVAAAASACLGKTSPPKDGPMRATTGTIAVRRIHSRLRLHALRTGWVRVKAAHRELASPHFWRFPRIILDSQWAEWMPIIVYAVERSDGSIVLVDTGPADEINDDSYFACNERNGWFYRRNLAFDVSETETLAERMREAGLSAEMVTHVVITHFHADHMGNVAMFPSAEFIVGPGNWPSHVGSATCQLGEGWRPTIASYADGPVAGFDVSQILGPDSNIRMVPLPGHTPGHAGVVVQDGDRAWLLAGDATFDYDQTERGAVSGVTADVEAALRTQAKIKAGVEAGRLVMLPAHDPAAFGRLTGATETATTDSPERSRSTEVLARRPHGGAGGFAAASSK